MKEGWVCSLRRRRAEVEAATKAPQHGILSISYIYVYVKSPMQVTPSLPFTASHLLLWLLSGCLGSQRLRVHRQNNTLYYLLGHEASRQHWRGGVRQGETSGFISFIVHSRGWPTQSPSVHEYKRMSWLHFLCHVLSVRTYRVSSWKLLFFLSASEIYLLLLLIFLSLTITYLRKYLSSRNGQRRRLHVLTQEMVKNQDENIFVGMI